MMIFVQRVMVFSQAKHSTFLAISQWTMNIHWCCYILSCLCCHSFSW